MEFQEKKLPRFTFEISDPDHKAYRCIMAGDAIFHRVKDMDEFLESLGYKKEFHVFDHILPAEFISRKYTCNNATEHPECLQANIIRYLQLHSVTFNEIYGDLTNDWHNRCEKAYKKPSTNCPDCELHKP